MAKKLTRESKIEKARTDNTFFECSCCYENEFLDEDMMQCSSDNQTHLNCKKCIKTHVETRIGDGNYKFECLTSGCKYEYTLKTISELLKPNELSKLLINLQNEEIRNASIENLESCNYCSYAAIIENQNEKVFYCLNPECLKETCRYISYLIKILGFFC
jgi:TRIAD3 protein (E3 ubiquitin-protein ligase RNF216)